MGLTDLLLAKEDYLRRVEELTEDDAIEFEKIVNELIKKIDNVGSFKKIFDNRINLIKDEISSLNDYKKTLENKYKWFEQYLYNHLEMFGETYEDKNKKGKKLKGDRITLKSWDKLVLKGITKEFEEPKQDYHVSLTFSTEKERDSVYDWIINGGLSYREIDTWETDIEEEETPNTKGTIWELEKHVTILGVK